MLRWGRILGATPPSAVLVHWARDGESAGFRAETTPAGAQALLQQVILWLLVRHDPITAHVDGPTYFVDVNGMLRDLWAKCPTPPRAARGVLDRACPVCKFAFGAHWPDDAEVDGFVLACWSSGYSQQPPT